MSINIPVWGIGVSVTLFLAFMGMVVAHVKSFTKLTDSVGYLGDTVKSASNSIASLSTSVATLASDVRMLNSAVEKIPGLERAVAKTERDIYDLRTYLKRAEGSD